MGLPSVSPLVLGEGRAVAEGLAADPAFVWLLPSVDPPVLGKVGALPEGLATVLALVGFLTRVCTLVLAQR